MAGCGAYHWWDQIGAWPSRRWRGEVLWLTLFHQPDASNLIVLELQQADD
jgi:hypothetical protein